jgi:hypothetical protein
LGSAKVSPNKNAIKHGTGFLAADDRFFNVYDKDFESQKVE